MSVSFNSSLIVGIRADEADLVTRTESTIRTPCAHSEDGAFCSVCGQALTKQVERYEPTPLGKLVGIEGTDDEDEMHDALLDGGAGGWGIFVAYDMVDNRVTHRIVGVRIVHHDIMDTHCDGISGDDVGKMISDMTGRLVEHGISHHEVGVWMLSDCG